MSSRAETIGQLSLVTFFNCLLVFLEGSSKNTGEVKSLAKKKQKKTQKKTKKQTSSLKVPRAYRKEAHLLIEKHLLEGKGIVETLPRDGGAKE